MVQNMEGQLKENDVIITIFLYSEKRQHTLSIYYLILI